MHQNTDTALSPTSGGSNYPTTHDGSPVSLEQPESSKTAHSQDDANSSAFIDGYNSDRSGTLVNVLHLELFNHFSEIICPLFAGKDPDLCLKYLKNYHKAAFSGVYLMHEILAFAARHLSITGHPSKTQRYAREATVLQTRALSLFNASLQDPQADTIIATFLFSSLLGTHLLSDTIASRHMDLDSFLGHFVGYLKVSE